MTTTITTEISLTTYPMTTVTMISMVMAMKGPLYTIGITSTKMTIWKLLHCLNAPLRYTRWGTKILVFVYKRCLAKTLKIPRQQPRLKPGETSPLVLELEQSLLPCRRRMILIPIATLTVAPKAIQTAIRTATRTATRTVTRTAIRTATRTVPAALTMTKKTRLLRCSSNHNFSLRGQFNKWSRRKVWHRAPQLL